MENKVRQFRYYGEGNSLNYPSSITSTKLKSGSVFDDVVPIILLGVLALPGTRFRINSNTDWTIIGTTGIFELDLTNSSGTITTLLFDGASLDIVNECDDAYLIIDFLYLEDD